jgi:phosphoribosylglycinamide formyltransferase-1
MVRRRTAVLISGGGSNLQALIDAARAADFPAEPVLVLSSRPEALGLARAVRAGLPARCVDPRTFPRRADFEAALDAALRAAGAELVCLAGFMRILSPGFVAQWRDRLLNIHPSLLPAFPGRDTHARALAAGCAVHGCTVHLVRAEVDQGPILVQGIVPVLPGDTTSMLAARVLEVEHRCYPRAVALLASGRARLAGEIVAVAGETAGDRLVVHPALAR